MGAEMVLRGPSRALLRIDLSSRLEFGETSSWKLTPTEAMGVVPSMLLQRAMAAHTRYEHGQPIATAAGLLPSAARNLVRGGLAYPAEGGRTQKGAGVIPKGKVTAAEQVAQSLGLESANVARAYEERDRIHRVGTGSQDLTPGC
jgi:hypothetical protein